MLVRWLGEVYPLRLPEVLAEVEDGKERGQESDILQLEAVRMRDLQETIPLCLQVEWYVI